MKSIMSRFAGRPIMLSGESADLQQTFAALETSWTIHGDRIASDLAAAEGFWPAPGTYMSQVRPYVVVDGVLQIPVKGILLNDFPFAFAPYATGYEYIEAAIARGIEDRSVQTIALMVDSPGGMVTGCFEVSDAIFAARESRRIVAYVNDHAYSAAYATASAANEIIVTRTGGVGSIGVVTYHIDASGAYAQMGLVKTYIYAGKHKVDGNETAPLSEEAKARTEERLQATYDVFVSTVARNRSLSAQSIRDTEALTYTASRAIEIGLADRIGSYTDAIWPPSAEPLTGDDDMAEKTQAAETITPDQMATAVTEAATAAYQNGVNAERARISAILGSDAAKARPVAAQQAAFVLGLDADKAAAFLSAMPEEKAAKSSFVKDMDASAPGLGGNFDMTEQQQKSRATRAMDSLRGRK